MIRHSERFSELARALHRAAPVPAVRRKEQIVKGLPDMIVPADDLKLKQAFQSHLQESKVHVTTLEELTGDVIEADVDKKDPMPTVHYEIASYGSVRDWLHSLVFLTTPPPWRNP